MADTAFNATLLKTDEAVETPIRRAVRRLFRRKGAIVGLAIILLFLAVAVFAPLLSPYDPIVQSWTSVRKAPSALHWFGTDDVGRDILVRVMFGARASLMAGVISVGIALTIGVPLGLTAGYLGGFTDALISRITDAMLAAGFLALGLWIGARVLARPAPTQPFDGNPKALAELGISPREAAVLAELAAGYANKEIARRLDVSPNTVKTHVARLYEKLGATRRTDAVRRARELGLVR